MLRIWLARHGEAVDPETVGSDFDRTLTARGRQQVAGFTRWIINLEEPPELILHSPLVRAQQTAETIAAEFGELKIPVRIEQLLAPGIDTDALLHQLAATALERVVCVGHQPDMSRCLAEMIGGGQISYAPGSIARVEFRGPITRSGGHLVWFIEPAWFG